MGGIAFDRQQAWSTPSMLTAALFDAESRREHEALICPAAMEVCPMRGRTPRQVLMRDLSSDTSCCHTTCVWQGGVLAFILVGRNIDGNGCVRRILRILRSRKTTADARYAATC